MKKNTKLMVARLLVFGLFILPSQNEVFGQLPGTTRKNLQKQDLAIPNYEVVQAEVKIKPGITAARHSHPGEEVVYMLSGVLEYHVDGRSPVTLKAGDVLFIPAGAIHSVKNVGNVPASELATYIVQKGKPLLVLAN